MVRWMGPLLGALLLALPLQAADKPAGDKPADEKKDDRAKQFEDLQKASETAQEAAVKEFRAAKTDEERDAIRTKFTEEWTGKALKLVEADPKDETSFKALSFAFRLSGGENAKVIALLTEHHAKNPEIKSLCAMLIQGAPASAAKLLEKVLADNPNNDAKGMACLGLAGLAADKVDKGDKAALEEAEKYYERAEKEFGEVKIGRATEAEYAHGALYELRNLRIGLPVPNVASEDLKGMKTELKEFKGKVLVLDIWATWCGPCRAMIPHEREMVEKFKEKPFALISVSADAKKETLEQFLEKEEMPWTHWWQGPDGNIVKGWNVRFFPTIYVVDAKGVIRYKNIRGKELEDAVVKLLDEVKK